MWEGKTEVLVAVYADQQVGEKDWGMAMNTLLYRQQSKGKGRIKGDDSVKVKKLYFNLALEEVY